MFLVSGRREGLLVQLRLGRVLDDGGEGAVVVEEEGELEPEAWRSPQLLSTLAIAEGREGRERSDFSLTPVIRAHYRGVNLATG